MSSTSAIPSSKTPHLASKEPGWKICRFDLNKLAARVSALFPQKTNIESLEKAIDVMQSPANRIQLAKEVRKEVTAQRQSLIDEFFTLCGNDPLDPASQLFSAKRIFLDREAAYNREAKEPFDRKATTSSNKAMQPVFDALQELTRLQQRSQTVLHMLCQLGHTVQSDPELLHFFNEDKKALLARKTTLCGTHPQDPNALLFKAHQKYVKGLNGPKAKYLFEYHQNLLERKIGIDSKLHLIDQMLPSSANPALSLDSIVSKKIEHAVMRIQRRIEEEKDNGCIDWRSTAVYAMHAIVPVVACAINFYSGEEAPR